MSEDSDKHSADLHFMAKTFCSKAKEHGKGNESEVSAETTVLEASVTNEEKVKHSTDLHFMAKTACSKAKEHDKESGTDHSPEVTVSKTPVRSEEKVKVHSDLHFMAKTACSKAKEHEKGNEPVVISEITVAKIPVKTEEKVKGSHDLHFMSKTSCSKAKEHGKLHESVVKIATPKTPAKSEDKAPKTNEKGSPSLHFMTKTSCSKAKEHGKASVVPKYKPATHSGIKFVSKPIKNKPVAPFVFDSPKKATPRSRERSPAKRTIVEGKVKGTEKHVTITTEHKRTSKGSREFSSSRSSRSLSRERTVKISEMSSTKSSGTKASSVSKKSSSKVESKPASMAKSALHSSNIQKPTQSSAAKTHAKLSSDQQCPPSEKPKVVTSNETTVEFEMKKSASHSSTVQVIEKVLSNGVQSMSGKPLNGEMKGNVIESDLLDETKLENLLNELNLESEIANAMTTIESVSMKNASKIPRKKGAPQSDMNQNKMANTQLHSCDNGIIPNGKKDTVVVAEMSAVHITNVN